MTMKKNNIDVQSEECDCEHHRDGGQVLTVEKNLFLFGEINVETTGMFMSSLKQADSTPGDINICICSLGGWVEGGLCMYDLIKSCKNNVTTIGCGAVYSAAVLPFEAGDCRLLYPSARLLLHEISMNPGEIKLNTIQNLSRETNRIYELSLEHLSKISGTSKKVLHDLCTKETFLTANQALKIHLADSIIAPMKKRKGKNV